MVKIYNASTSVIVSYICQLKKPYSPTHYIPFDSKCVHKRRCYHNHVYRMWLVYDTSVKNSYLHNISTCLRV